MQITAPKKPNFPNILLTRQYYIVTHYQKNASTKPVPLPAKNEFRIHNKIHRTNKRIKPILMASGESC